MFRQEDYVSLEVAKLLKEKGFNERCERRFVEKIDGTEREEWDDESCCICEVSDVIYYPKPTLYEAQKWLRNEHQIHISVGMCSDYSTNTDGEICDEWNFWTFSTYYTTSLKHIHDCFGEYETYEEALNAGINEALKLI